LFFVFILADLSVPFFLFRNIVQKSKNKDFFLVRLNKHPLSQNSITYPLGICLATNSIESGVFFLLLNLSVKLVCFRITCFIPFWKSGNKVQVKIEVDNEKRKIGDFLMIGKSFFFQKITKIERSHCVSHSIYFAKILCFDFLPKNENETTEERKENNKTEN